MRQGSKFCQYLRQRKKEEAEARERKGAALRVAPNEAKGKEDV
jgi:hypothetical protein